METRDRIVTKIISGQNISFDEAVELSVKQDLETLLIAADRIRETTKGNHITLCSVMNAKSGRCAEDCKYCAQSIYYDTDAREHALVDIDEIVGQAQENERKGIHCFSLVVSGKGIEGKDFQDILKAYKILKQRTKLKLCGSLGILSYQQLLDLKRAGLMVFHHNLQTSEDYFKNIITTHTFEERISTIKYAQAAGLEVCSGGIIGMGESMEARLKMAFKAKELNVKHIPINILIPIKGTPMESVKPMEAIEILKTIALFRMINPDAQIIFAAGRSYLNDMEKYIFKSGVSAMITGNYLTTSGNAIERDQMMIECLGLSIKPYH